jgi:hypothetical protein
MIPRLNPGIGLFIRLSGLVRYASKYDHTNQGAVASTEASKARGRFGFGLTHRNEFFFSEILVRKALHLVPSREIEMPSKRSKPTRRGALEPCGRRVARATTRAKVIWSMSPGFSKRLRAATMQPSSKRPRKRCPGLLSAIHTLLEGKP